MNIVIGKRSNLSQMLCSFIEDIFLVSSDETFFEIISQNKFSNKGIKLIFNNFQASTKLYDDRSLDIYIESCIGTTSKILTTLEKNKVNIDKIIYTSSSSVYGNNKFCSESDVVMPMSLQSALKVANEELVKRFCEVRNINYTIARVFNMYGGEDKFSVISKIKDAYVNNQPLNIINGGASVRDYIHINDVVNIYMNLLEMDILPKVLNVASGNGKRVNDILNNLNSKGIKIHTTNIKRDEIMASIANIDLLNTLVDTSSFIQVEDYLLKELRK